MEVLAIIFWVAVLGADIAFMLNIKRIADEVVPVNKKRPGRGGAQTRGCQKMTDLVYTITRGASRGMVKAMVIRTAGDRALCDGVGRVFESAELGKTRTREAVMRAGRDAARARELAALRIEVEAYIRRGERRERVWSALRGLVGRLFKCVS